MLTEKLRWAYKLLRSKTFVVLLDKQSVVFMPLVDLEAFENQFILAAQTASLHQFKERLEGLIREHEEAIQLLAHRESNKQTPTKRQANRTNVQKKTTKKG
jgi:hypothetical protein